MSTSTPIAPPKFTLDKLTIDARATVHKAALSWSDDEVRCLAYVINLGRPHEVLAKLRASVQRGIGADSSGPNARPPTTAAEWALSGVLTMWREVGAVLGIKILPAPSAHTNISRR